MVEQLPRKPSQQGSEGNETSMSMPVEPQCCTRKWYFSRDEIELHSPSRKDGIDLKKESRLRKLYCSFLQELGMTLKVPQVTIANAIMLCHQFYMRQSHAKNDWKTIAIVSMFLGCKIEDTPRLRKDVVIGAYEILHKRDPSAPERIRQKEVYNKQQELLLIGERFLLATIAFDLDIQLPYKPLVAALKKLKLGDEIPQLAWNFVNDWLCTTLCLQYKPHYIAAGSVFLAAKYQKVKLPTKRGNVWWLEFDISPKLLEEVIKHMLKLLEEDKGQSPAPTQGRAAKSTSVVGKPVVSDPKSSIMSITSSIAGRYCNDGVQVEAGELGKLTSSNNLARGTGDSIVASREEVLPSQTSSESGNTGSVVEDGDGENPPGVGDSNQSSNCKIVSVENRAGGSDQNSSCEIVSVDNRAGSVVQDGDREKLPEAAGNSDRNSSCKAVSVDNPDMISKHMIDAVRIREALKRRRNEKATNSKSIELKNDEMDVEAWIERKLESEIELEYGSSEKKPRT